MTRLFAVALSFALLTAPAMAVECVKPLAPRDALIKELTGTKYEETPVAKALTKQGAMLEIFANAKTKTYTIILSSPRGCSKVTSAGDFWELQPEVTPGEDS